jgi:hypothetical protein
VIDFSPYEKETVMGTFWSWLGTFNRFTPNRSSRVQKQARRKKKPYLNLCLERLEDRLVPSAAPTDTIGFNFAGQANSSSANDSSSLTANTPSQPGLTPIVTDTGSVYLSLDGLGTNNPAGGTIQVQKPDAQATVKAAYLMAASTGFSGYQITNTDVTLDGKPVSFDSQYSIPNHIGSFNYFADVTNLVKPTVDAASPGLVDFTVAEGAQTDNIDGEILAVIFNDPQQPSSNTIVLMYGALDPTGDTFSLRTASPINTSDPNLLLDMSLGDSFSYDTPTSSSQYSVVTVNGKLLTSSAGGQDDGQNFPVQTPTDYTTVGDGALMTVGGIGDSNANPSDPTSHGDATSPRYDDELYSLIPFVNNGDTTIKVNTVNPSNDDNIFFAAFNLHSITAVVGEGVVLGPSTQTVAVNSTAKVTATVQDNNGNPLVGKTVNFVIKSGPDAGMTGSGVTDGKGQTSFSFKGANAGDDVVQASFVDDQGSTITSNPVDVVWKAEKITPSFVNLSAPSITVGTASTTISGHLDSNVKGQTIPAGETVKVSLNGVTKNATLDSSDNFSVSFDTSTLSVAGSPYTISFAYGGDANFNPASGSSKLTVHLPTPVFTNLSAPVITAGTELTTISGHLDSTVTGQIVPSGEIIKITLNGVTHSARLNLNDNFKTTFDTSALGASGSPYTISFSYGGDPNFNPATGHSTLTVNHPLSTPTLRLYIDDPNFPGGPKGHGNVVVYDGSPYDVIANIAGVNGIFGPSLEGVMPIVTYYAGSTPSGTPLSGPPANVGTYTAVAYFPGSTNYKSAKTQLTYMIE